MYPYEDRLRAVRRYIKLGMRVGLTIRQLGYPTKNALKAWCREFEQSRDLPAGYVRQPKYTPACKERAVEHYLEHRRCIAATVKELGYPSRTLLVRWLQEFHRQERVRVIGQFRQLTPENKQSVVRTSGGSVRGDRQQEHGLENRFASCRVVKGRASRRR